MNKFHSWWQEYWWQKGFENKNDIDDYKNLEDYLITKFGKNGHNVLLQQ